MAVQLPATRIISQPSGQELIRCLILTEFVVDVGTRMRCPRVGPIGGQRALGTWFRGGKQSAFALRERVLRGKPPVIVVVRSKPIHEVEQFALSLGPSAEAIEPEDTGCRC